MCSGTPEKAIRRANVTGLRAAYLSGTCSGVPPISIRASRCKRAPPRMTETRRIERPCRWPSRARPPQPGCSGAKRPATASPDRPCSIRSHRSVTGQYAATAAIARRCPACGRGRRSGHASPTSTASSDAPDRRDRQPRMGQMRAGHPKNATEDGQRCRGRAGRSRAVSAGHVSRHTSAARPHTPSSSPHRSLCSGSRACGRVRCDHPSDRGT